MIKVREFLNNNFKHTNKNTAELKEDGHYSVYGLWLYNITQSKFIDYKERVISGFDNCISIRCFDETLDINIIIDGKKEGKYDYFQTYSKLPRDTPDENGFFKKSTDEEIIHYIQSYLDIINQYR